MIAILKLPKVNTPVQGESTNMNGYWDPPNAKDLFNIYLVKAHWCGACKIEYVDNSDFDLISKIVLQSYEDCLSQFYRENAL